MLDYRYEEIIKLCKDIFYYGCEVDSWLIEVVLLPYVTLNWKQLPVWVRVIAPPSSGKSAHLSLLYDYHKTYLIDDLSPKSLVSGYRGNNEDPSQLPQMDKHVLLISDESTMVEQRKEDRAIVQSLFRRAYDGSVTKSFGNLKDKVELKAAFNMLIAATPLVDRYYLYNQALGERFINYRLQVPDRVNIAKRAVANQSKNYGAKMRRLTKCITRYLKTLDKRKFDYAQMSDDTRDSLVQCASFIALLRTHVVRDVSGRYITLLPQPEVGSRLVQQMMQVAIGTSVIRGEKKVSTHSVELAIYTGLCSAPSMNVYVLYMFWCLLKKTNREWHSAKEIMIAAHLGQLSTHQYVEDLCVHQILQMRKGTSQGGRLLEYRIHPTYLKVIDKIELFKNYVPTDRVVPCKKDRSRNKAKIGKKLGKNKNKRFSSGKK